MRAFQGLSAAIFILFSAAMSAFATPSEPPRGSQLRQDLLDTFRPLAVFDLGAPIEFRVIELQVDGDIAFARLMAQRPGGAEIDMAQTPMVQWRYMNPYDFDGPRFEVFFIRQGDHWQIVQYGLGSTDAWWFGYRCETFGSLLRAAGC